VLSVVELIEENNRSRVNQWRGSFRNPRFVVQDVPNHSQIRADVAQPVEQRFRKLPRSIQPAITKNQSKRRIDGRQAPNPSPRTPVHLYAYAALSRRGFFWLYGLIRAGQQNQ